ncbi:MAG: aminotransferase class I/II-fold pyridoxal phosphate-dependent enzyme [Acidimicrobiales bacterium]
MRGEAGFPEPGAHGGDGPRLARLLGIAPSRVLDLSASLNPVAPDISTILAPHLESVGRYPDPEPATHALAAAMGVDAGRLLLTNGGAEAIAVVAAELGRGWVDEPEFSLYRRHLGVLDPTGPRWRSNPNNPTGRLAPPDAVAEVWDEAFWPLATGTWSRRDAGSIVVGSLTKVLACPGLRVGYILVPEGDLDLAGRLARRQPGWSLNGLAAAALPELLDVVDLPGWAGAVRALRAGLVGILRGAGIEPAPSDANFVLARAPGWRRRLARHAILLRDATNFGLPGHVRIGVPDEAGLARLAEALQSERMSAGFQ